MKKMLFLLTFVLLSIMASMSLAQTPNPNFINVYNPSGDDCLPVVVSDVGIYEGWYVVRSCEPSYLATLKLNAPSQNFTCPTMPQCPQCPEAATVASCQKFFTEDACLPYFTAQRCQQYFEPTGATTTKSEGNAITSFFQGLFNFTKKEEVVPPTTEGKGINVFGIVIVVLALIIFVAAAVLNKKRKNRETSAGIMPPELPPSIRKAPPTPGPNQSVPMGNYYVERDYLMAQNRKLNYHLRLVYRKYIELKAKTEAEQDARK